MITTRKIIKTRVKRKQLKENKNKMYAVQF